MDMEVVTDAAGLHALRSDWDRLSGEDPLANVFTSWDWHASWWRHYGTGRRLQVLVAREQGRAVAILPLYLERARALRVLPLRRLRYVGTGGDTSPDYLAPVCAPGAAESAQRALAGYLTRRPAPWDLLSLTDMPAEHPFGALVAELAGEQGFTVRKGTSANTFAIRLPGDYETYLAGLSMNWRKQVRRRRRRLERAGARFYQWQDALTLDGAMSHLGRLHRRRFADRAERYGFSSDSYTGFHLELASRLMGQNRLRLYCLELDGEVIAMLYCFRWRDRVSCFQGGFEPSSSTWAPGVALFGYAIEQSIAEGAVVFDMLKGKYDYKKALCNASGETLYLDVIARTAPGWAYELRRHRLPALKRSLPHRVPAEPVLAGLEAGGDDGSDA
ncbi:MAG TPA: GNAT family N-acetyltransferase [Gammaproteobacteria bacterium]|nr:GNAT family N-acetyltransferase [Gammaproteobacteria bacterium]